MNDIVTEDLSEFGTIELEEVSVLLREYTKDRNVLGDNVKPMFNRYSGYVFLTDENYDVAMMNGDTLERFYTCGNCGNEGFAEDFDDGECCGEQVVLE